MTHFDYNPKETTENELTEKVQQLFYNSTFQHGDIVKVKNDPNCPTMAIVGIEVRTQDIMYQKLSRKYIAAKCQWFNKSKQDFSDTTIPTLCLTKVEA